MRLADDKRKKVYTMEQTTNPNHYATANGKDLFALMEEGLLTPEQYNGFLVGNITKYLYRAEQKNGAEDLAKAGAYLATLGVKLYGVDFGPLLLEAVGAQLDKHTQPTTVVDEDDHTDYASGLNQSPLGIIATLNNEDLVTLADAATFAVRNDPHTYQEYFYKTLDDERRNVINLTFDNNTYLEDYEDLKKYAHEIIKLRNNITPQSLGDRAEKDEATDPVLEYLTDETNAEDFNNIRDLYREMLEAGIKDGDEARDYLIYSDNTEAKDALIRCFCNLDYSSDWVDMVKYFALVVTAQLQAEADEEAKAEAKPEPELFSKLNPVELSALKKAYRDIIELDTVDKRTKYLQANRSWLGFPLVRAFNNNNYREDVTDLLNWGFYNVTAGLPIPKSTRTEDSEHLELLNRAYNLMIFSYTKEEQSKAIRESSEADFSWDDSYGVADITTDLLGGNISGKISEDVITYFIDNPDQATYE